MITTILLVFSFVLGVLATIGIPSSRYFNLFAASFTFFVASVLFAAVHL